MLYIENMLLIRSTLVLIFLAFAPVAEADWQLKKEQDGIKVYTGQSPQPNIKAVRVECEIKTTLSRLAALLFDAPAHEDWIYSTEESYEVERINEQEQIYYSEITMPWPLYNREVVIHLKIHQDPQTHVMTVTATATKGYVDESKDKVRVTSSQAIWTVTPTGKETVKVEYVGWANPGGAVPAWAVNLFATKGPYESFRKLRALVNKPVYQAANLPFIKNYRG